MAKIHNYGFIFIGEGYDKKGEMKEINSESFSAKIVAVSSFESACEMLN